LLGVVEGRCLWFTWWPAERDADVQDHARVAARDADRLLDRGVTIAAIQSTSTYWKAPFYCLEEVMEV
jgi:hypothetical protein